jgi:hypothetical protein
MSDLLWLANHPLRVNVVGIPTSQDLDTSEGLESWLSIRIHRIPAKIPHLTGLELGKLCRTLTGFDRVSTLELLRGLLISRDSFGDFGRSASQLSLHWLWASDIPCTDLPWHIGKVEFEMAPPPGNGYPIHPPYSRLGPGFVPHHPLVSYSLWLCLILDMLKRCMDFSPYDAFPSSDVPEVVDQRNSWNSLVISTYLLYLEWNVGMFVVNICILWPPTSTQPEMAKPGPSSHWARPCSCSWGMGPCRASFGDFLQISIVLHLWPIEPVDAKHCNH